MLPYLIPIEKELIKNLKIKGKTKKPIIAISGMSGVGKDTHAFLLQKKLKERNGLNLEVSIAGHLVRKLAKEEGFEEKDMDKFMKKYEESENFAENVDKRIEKTTLEKALRFGGIFVGRMAAFTIGRWGYTIWLTVSPEVAAKRLISDPKRPEFGLNLEEVSKKIFERDETDKKRLEKIYGIKFDELIKKVDLKISNDLPLPHVSEEIYNNCVNFLKNMGYI